MPSRPFRPCAHPSCPVLVKTGRCELHARQAHTDDRQARGSAHQRGYTGEWREYRLRFLQRNPLCSLCEAEGRVEVAAVVDHIVAHKGDSALFWDPRNHRPLCRRHHNERTDEGDFGR